jgi:hypothetical protein
VTPWREIDNTALLDYVLLTGLSAIQTQSRECCRKPPASVIAAGAGQAILMPEAGSPRHAVFEQNVPHDDQRFEHTPLTVFHEFLE